MKLLCNCHKKLKFAINLWKRERDSRICIMHDTAAIGGDTEILIILLMAKQVINVNWIVQREKRERKMTQKETEAII
jgi:hypothetical protein